MSRQSSSGSSADTWQRRTDRASLIASAVAVALSALVAWAGSQGGWTLWGLPAFAWACALAFLIQWAVYVPSQIAQTETFFDLTGSATYILITLLLLFSAPALTPVGLLLGLMVIVWAARLGSFLFWRIRAAGADDRFDEIKTRPARFFRVWTLQGLWVSLTASAAWIAIGSQRQAEAGVLTLLGAALWAAGLAIEVTADVQKSRFRADPAHRGQFIRTGLWSRSRHPNYLGEILLWAGVFITAAPLLEGWQWGAVLSPVFVTVLLTRISGIPLLEAKADRLWGGTAEYEEYKRRTPVLLPRLRSIR